MTTWNPADIGPGIALSNGNLTATKTISQIFRCGRSTTSYSSGKRYFECSADSYADSVNFGIGVGTATFDILTYLGREESSWALYADGSLYNNDLAIDILPGYSVTGVIGCAIDFDAGSGWFSYETGSYGLGVPATGANPNFTFTPGTALFAAFVVNDNSPGDQVTANFGATSFTHTPPAGFEPWNASPVIEDTPITYGGGHGDDYERQVQRWWDEIDRLRAENKAKEEAERERQREIEAHKQALAELEAQRSRKKARKAQEAQREALRAEIAEAEREAAELRIAIQAILTEIARIEAEQRQFIMKRNAALALLLVAA